jgi:hypothetical protein
MGAASPEYPGYFSDNGTFFATNSSLAITLQIANKVNLSETGDVNATKFYGDGSSLTGITTTDGSKVGNNTDANLIYLNTTNVNSTIINASSISAPLDWNWLYAIPNYIRDYTDPIVNNITAVRAEIADNITVINNNLSLIWTNLSIMNATLGLKADRSELGSSGAEYPGYWVDSGDKLSLNESLTQIVNISNNVFLSSGYINVTGNINATNDVYVGNDMIIVNDLTVLQDITVGTSTSSTADIAIQDGSICVGASGCTPPSSDGFALIELLLTADRIHIGSTPDIDSNTLRVDGNADFGTLKVNVSTTGDVNATKFYGDGSALSGVLGQSVIDEIIGGINANVTELRANDTAQYTNISSINTSLGQKLDRGEVTNYDDSDLRESVNLNWTDLNANDTQIWINISAINASLGKKLETGTFAEHTNIDDNITKVRAESLDNYTDIRNSINLNHTDLVSLMQLNWTYLFTNLSNINNSLGQKADRSEVISSSVLDEVIIGIASNVTELRANDTAQYTNISSINTSLGLKLEQSDITSFLKNNTDAYHVVLNATTNFIVGLDMGTVTQALSVRGNANFTGNISLNPPDAGDAGVGITGWIRNNGTHIIIG